MSVEVIIAGLGNPGAAYQKNRHNAGFRGVEHLRKILGFPVFHLKDNSYLSSGTWKNRDILLCMPTTYMNHSGEAIAPLMRFYKLPLPRLLVIHDELDLPLGEVRFKQDGGHAGHNGLRSISQHLGPAYSRIRLGIGRPPSTTANRDAVSQYVLGNFTSAEEARVEDMMMLAADIAETFCLNLPQNEIS